MRRDSLPLRVEPETGRIKKPAAARLPALYHFCEIFPPAWNECTSRWTFGQSRDANTPSKVPAHFRNYM